MTGEAFFECFANVVFVMTAPIQRFVDSLALTPCEMKDSWFIRLQEDIAIITTALPGQGEKGSAKRGNMFETL